MTSDHSSVPRWPAVPPVPDPTGIRYGLIALGGAGAAVTSRWAAQVTAMESSSWRVGAADAVEAAGPVAERLGTESVGLRVMVAGPEHDVLVTSVLLHDHGLADAEITLHATSSDLRLVYCVHCTATSGVTAQPGQDVTCQGCGRPLALAAHLSRHTGSYLGYRTDAEQLDSTDRGASELQPVSR